MTCPITLCLQDDFKSHRGLRKHIANKHSWYYYFEDQQKVKKEDLPVFPETTKKVSTAHKPSYSVDKGLGKAFFIGFVLHAVVENAINKLSKLLYVL